MEYLKQNHLTILVIVFLVGSALLGTPAKQSLAPKVGVLDRTTVGNPWTFSGAVTNSGAVTFTSTATVGSSGTAISGLNFGNCRVLAYSNTITASSTAQVDCGSTGFLGGTLTNVSSGDQVFVVATTTLSTGAYGVYVQSARASSTSGYITLNITNASGNTFTWSGAASTTFKYLVIQ